MSQKKLQTFKYGKLTQLIASCLVLVLVAIFAPATPVSANHAIECSDVYTPLSSFVTNGVANNKSFYERAMNETGAPWEILAAIHYRETSFSHTNPSNGQGIFQFVNGDGGPYPPGPVSDENFYAQLRYMANRLQSDYVWRNSPNPASVQARRLTPNEQDINLVKNTLYSYNGRSSEYAAQATHFGFSQPYEGSPYVMNRFDCSRARMGLITRDYGNIDGIDTRYGAFTIFARLRGDNYWKLLTVPYSWSFVSQEVYYDPQRTNPAMTNMLAANQTVYLRIKARNIGNTSWTNTGSNPVNLGTNKPQDHISQFCDNSWVKCNRPASLKQSTVAPGEIGTFEFSIKVPSTYASYRQDFNLVVEGKTWMNDPGLYFSFEVKPPTYSWQLINKQAYIDSARSVKFTDDVAISPGGKAYFTIYMRNTGNETWTQDFLKLGTWGPIDRPSVFQDSSWLQSIRAAQLKEGSVSPGQIGSIEFTMQAHQTTGSYKESFNLVAESRTWLNDVGLNLNIDVVTPIPASNASNTYLASGQSLKVGQFLLSPDRHSVLTLQKDGNLVLYSDYKPVWHSNTAGYASDRLVMQTDGNLVLYSKNNVALWNTETAGNNNSNLFMQTDGNLVLYNTASQPVWATYTIHRPDHLSHVNSTLNNAALYQGQQLETANRKYRLVLQTDGNLVLYSDRRALWATYTIGKQNNYLIMQADGNLVLYDVNGTPLWYSSTSGKGLSRLVIQADGNLVLYDEQNKATWNTFTQGQN